MHLFCHEGNIKYGQFPFQNVKTVIDISHFNGEQLGSAGVQLSLLKPTAERELDVSFPEEKIRPRAVFVRIKMFDDQGPLTEAVSNHK